MIEPHKKDSLRFQITPERGAIDGLRKKKRQRIRKAYRTAKTPGKPKREMFSLAAG